MQSAYMNVTVPSLMSTFKNRRSRSSKELLSRSLFSKISMLASALQGVKILFNTFKKINTMSKLSSWKVKIYLWLTLKKIRPKRVSKNCRKPCLQNMKKWQNLSPL
jgi:hypothetical protein